VGFIWIEYLSAYLHICTQQYSQVPKHHPIGNGQTEHVSQTLEQYLQVYCNYQQANWSKLLPLSKFTYNNAPNAITGISPFFTNKGYHLNIAIHPE